MLLQYAWGLIETGWGFIEAAQDDENDHRRRRSVTRGLELMDIGARVMRRILDSED